MPPECNCLRAALPRLVLLYDLTLSYYPLPLCLRFGSLTQFPSTLDLYDLAAACQGGIAALAAVMSAVIFQQIADGAVQHAADAGQNVKVKFFNVTAIPLVDDLKAHTDPSCQRVAVDAVTVHALL